MLTRPFSTIVIIVTAFLSTFADAILADVRPSIPPGPNEILQEAEDKEIPREFLLQRRSRSNIIKCDIHGDWSFKLGGQQCHPASGCSFYGYQLTFRFESDGVHFIGQSPDTFDATKLHTYTGTQSGNELSGSFEIPLFTGSECGFVFHSYGTGTFTGELADCDTMNFTLNSDLWSFWSLDTCGPVPGGSFTGDAQLCKVGCDFPTVKLRVDANRDGFISFADEGDKTSVSKPYRFWINNDDDLKNNTDAVPIRTPDSSDDVIDGVRDLEDFAQIQIRLSPQVGSLLINRGYKLFLETPKGLRINVFPAEQEGNGYLLDSSVAQRQTSKKAINLNDLLPALDRVSLQQNRETTFYGLFEGKTVGTGTVRLVLRAPNGSVAASDEVFLTLLDVRAMYERAYGTPLDGFQPPYDPSYILPRIGFAQETLPPFVPPSDEARDMIVFVHGCCIGTDIYRNISDTMLKRLWWQGYRGRFASFRWPATQAGRVFSWNILVTNYNEQEFRAWKYAVALEGYLADLQRRLPNNFMHVIAHSMGNIVVGEALKRGAKVNNYILSQGAVPADCYDTSPTLYDRGLLLDERTRRLPPAPYEQEELGYAGYFSDLDVRGLIINFYNPRDFALDTWKVNNRRKPDQELISGVYWFSPQRQLSFFSSRLVIPKPSYQVTDPHEVKAFVSRSKTAAVGQEGRTFGPLDRRVDLSQAPYNFGTTLSEHGAQFDRSIQDAHTYYYMVLKSFGVQ